MLNLITKYGLYLNVSIRVRFLVLFVMVKKECIYFVCKLIVYITFILV